MSLALEAGAVVRLTSGKVGLIVAVYTMAGVGVFYDVLINEDSTMLIDETDIEGVL